MDPAGNAISLAKDIYALADLIHTQIKLVKANKEQSGLLGKRIHTLTQCIQNLATGRRIANFVSPLTELKVLLQECLDFICLFSNETSWFKQVFKAQTQSNKFQSFNQALDRCLQQLTLGLAAQHLLNEAEDKTAQAIDLNDIKSREEEILQLNIQAKQQLERIDQKINIAGGDLQKLVIDEQERHALLCQQLASMRCQFDRFLQARPTEEKKEIAPISPRLQIPFHELTFDGLIAKGSFGKVYLGRYQNQVVATKILEKFNFAEREEFIREVKIMNTLRSPHVVQLYGACLEEGRACMVMEYLDGGALDHYLMHHPLSLEQKQQIAKDIAIGLDYIHKRGVVHCDLKSGNILIDKSSGRAKLTDFGLAKTTHKDISATNKMSEAIAWMAPEVLNQQTPTTKSDIFSYGMILWQIYSGKSRPFLQATNNLKKEIIAGKREEITREIPAEIAALIRQCWDKDPENRPLLENVIQQLTGMMCSNEKSMRSASKNISSEEAETFYLQGIEYEKQQLQKKAVVCYQKAVEQGHIKAKTNLGYYYLKGLADLPLDKSYAFKLFNEAANAGHVRAMNNLVLMYRRGDGVVPNEQIASEWEKKAKEPEKLQNNVSQSSPLIQPATSFSPKLHTFEKNTAGKSPITQLNYPSPAIKKLPSAPSTPPTPPVNPALQSYQGPLASGSPQSLFNGGAKSASQSNHQSSNMNAASASLNTYQGNLFSQARPPSPSSPSNKIPLPKPNSFGKMEIRK